MIERARLFALHWMEAISLTMINNFFWIIRHFTYKKDIKTYELLDLVVCNIPTEENVYSRRIPPKKKAKNTEKEKKKKTE